MKTRILENIDAKSHWREFFSLETLLRPFLIVILILLLADSLFEWGQKNYQEHYLDFTPSLKLLEKAPAKNTAKKTQGLIEVRADSGEYFSPLQWARARKERSEKSYRSFFNVPRPFTSRIDLTRIGELTNGEFENLVLSSLPRFLRTRLKKFISLALDYAEKYQIDPFWSLAIMWVESHFNPKATSHVKAIGLMQIMPDTGSYLAPKIYSAAGKKMNSEMVYVPQVNMEMGAYYLRFLAKMFAHNHHLATRAYNVGPYAIKKRLRKRKPLVGGQYLSKVQRAYDLLSAPYRKYFKNLPRPYSNSFVARSKKASQFPSANEALALGPLPWEELRLASAH